MSEIFCRMIELAEVDNPIGEIDVENLQSINKILRNSLLCQRESTVEKPTWLYGESNIILFVPSSWKNEHVNTLYSTVRTSLMQNPCVELACGLFDVQWRTSHHVYVRTIPYHRDRADITDRWTSIVVIVSKHQPLFSSYD